MPDPELNRRLPDEHIHPGHDPATHRPGLLDEKGVLRIVNGVEHDHVGTQVIPGEGRLVNIRMHADRGGVDDAIVRHAVAGGPVDRLAANLRGDPPRTFQRAGTDSDIDSLLPQPKSNSPCRSTGAEHDRRFHGETRAHDFSLGIGLLLRERRHEALHCGGGVGIESRHTAWLKHQGIGRPNRLHKIIRLRYMPEHRLLMGNRHAQARQWPA